MRPTEPLWLAPHCSAFSRLAAATTTTRAYLNMKQRLENILECLEQGKEATGRRAPLGGACDSSLGGSVRQLPWGECATTPLGGVCDNSLGGSVQLHHSALKVASSNHSNSKDILQCETKVRGHTQILGTGRRGARAMSCLGKRRRQGHRRGLRH
jgi:hypothetical protein